MSKQHYQFPGYSRPAEPKLQFHCTRENDRHVHPLEGLLQFGPYSSSLLRSISDPILIASIVPSGVEHWPKFLATELETSHKPRERKNYLPSYPGFTRIFRVRAVLAPPPMQLSLPPDLDSRLAKSTTPHLVLADALARAMEVLGRHRAEFSVVVLFLPDRWKPGFVGPDGFDLHDHIKAVGASMGIPVQILLESSALNYHCRASVMWRLSIAIFAKSGGVPWTIAELEADTAFVGLSYALRASTEQSKFITCCSLVFDSEGSGPEFLLYHAQPYYDGVNPFLKREEMRAVVLRSLAVYRQRHAGRNPRRVVVHKTTQFKDGEVAGALDAVSGIEFVDLLQVQQNSQWRGVAIASRGTADSYPCQRGVYLPIGPRDALLWTQGNVKGTVTDYNYYKEMKGIPAPLRLTRFAGHGGWDYTCNSILALTKLNWNNDSLYDRLPVTLSYADVLARTIKCLREPRETPYQLRFFM